MPVRVFSSLQGERAHPGLCTPVRDIHYFSRKRQIGVYRMQEAWYGYHAFIACDPVSGAQFLAFAKLKVDYGGLIVICKANPSRGIDYIMRTNEAEIAELFIETEAGSDEFKQIDRAIRPSMGSYLTGQKIYVDDEVFDRNPTVPHGMGIVLEPTLKEAMKVAKATLDLEDIEDEEEEEEEEDDDEIIDHDEEDEKEEEDILEASVCMDMVTGIPRKKRAPVRIVRDEDEESSDFEGDVVFLPDLSDFPEGAAPDEEHISVQRAMIASLVSAQHPEKPSTPPHPQEEGPSPSPAPPTVESGSEPTQ
jgi:hypothetical protein